MSLSSLSIEVRPAGSVTREPLCHICASLQDSIFKFQMDIMESKQKCLDLCDTWTYDARLTFTSLAEEMEDSGNIIYNEVVIMVDPEYRLESDTLKFDLISFFAAIGDGLGLFLGISNFVSREREMNQVPENFFAAAARSSTSASANIWGQCWCIISKNLPNCAVLEIAS